MKYLLDTHALIWCLSDDAALSITNDRKIIENYEVETLLCGRA